MMKKSKSGFTLAEVLTTLMVIGVVAAMTIPTLMNSTGDQQAKVAAKKAASILSQGVQLLMAKEEECVPLTNDVELASCLSQVISGTLAGNTITTPDGMVYAFYVNPKVGDMDIYATSLETVCGERVGTNSGVNNCGVAVDTNGYSKGVKAYFDQAIEGEGDNPAPPTGHDVDSVAPFDNSGFTTAAEMGSDRLAFVLSATGVKPAAVKNGGNKAWNYIYGGNPDPTTDYASKLCCKDKIDCEGTSGYTCQSYYIIGGNGACPSNGNYTPIDLDSGAGMPGCASGS